MLCRTSTDAPQKSAPRKCSFWTASSISMGGKQVPPSMTYKPIERNSHRTGGYMMLCNEPLKKLPKGIQAALRGSPRPENSVSKQHFCREDAPGISSTRNRKKAARKQQSAPANAPGISSTRKQHFSSDTSCFQSTTTSEEKTDQFNGSALRMQFLDRFACGQGQNDG